MLGSWIFYAVIAVTTLTGGLLATRKGRTWLKRQRRKRWTKTKRDTKSAIRARVKRRAQTPRGKLKAKRKAQAPRLTFGHVRTPDDPTRSSRVTRWTGTKVKTGAVKAKNGTVKAAGTARDRYRVHRENRKAAKAETGTKAIASGPRLFPGEGGTAKPDRHAENLALLKSRGYCLAKCQDGTRCHNKMVVGGDRCHVHGGRSAA